MMNKTTAISLLKESRETIAACFRVIAATDDPTITTRLEWELLQAGVENGMGVRIQNWIKAAETISVKSDERQPAAENAGNFQKPMKPYYQDSAVTIYHGDCTMGHLPSASSLVTDPPYGIAWGRATWSDDPEKYGDLMRWLVHESETSGCGWCFVFQSMPNVAKFHEWFPVGWRIFAACKNFAQIRPTGIWHSWDPVVFWANGKPDRDHDYKPNRDYFVGNIAGVFNEEIDHPSPKPMDTMRHIIGLCSKPGEIILDPFMGSGTTLRAAKDLGRKAIGIEIEERYCEIAAKRMEQECFDFCPVKVEEQITPLLIPEEVKTFADVKRVMQGG